MEDVLVEVRDQRATVTFNRPDAYNAYLTETLVRVADVFTKLSADDKVGVVILTGAGTRSFCTGGDVKEYAERYTKRPREYWTYIQHFRRAIESILKCPKPVIARLNGMAVGGGNEFHLACDLSVIGDHAWVGQVGTGVGSVACGGATQWLPLHVGDRRARQMLFLNPRVPARQALEWGLVTDVAPCVRRGSEWAAAPAPDAIEKAQKGQDGWTIDLSKLDARVGEIAEGILAKFPECLRYTKAQVNFWKELVWHSTISHGGDWLTLHFACVEPREGMTAFAEKRKADVAGLRERAARGETVEFLWGAYVRACPGCGAKGLPEAFTHCGKCGKKL